MTVPDPLYPPPLNSYWNERLKQLWIDLYAGSFFLHGESAAQEIKEAQIAYEENYYPAEATADGDA